MQSFSDLAHGSLDALTRFDDVVLALIILSGLGGFVRGFATEISGLFSWVMAIAVTNRLHMMFEPYLAPYVHDVWLLQIFSGILVFLVTLLFLAMVGRKIAGIARVGLLSGVDRVLGLGYGLFRGYLVIVTLCLIGGAFFETTASYLMQRSLTAPYIVAGETRLVGYLPLSWRSHLASLATSGHDAR
ncbi:CvpA family protein [Neokomagataea anthophila]|uniref:CvpA family protein n=1 Tax=Neokomagataea anthophila TaxID=2826925 RepID=A0ABS5E644_9PROT|nr:CvpA family protein [Neokomagataea anthophila]MBR0559377.1 CvpA family protein [Neokomagataea anthophila]